MTDKEAMATALDALELSKISVDNFRVQKATQEAITALKERLTQRTEQEPVAHLWECLGRWSAYLVDNGVQADCAPPSWLVDAVKNATTPPQRTEQSGWRKKQIDDAEEEAWRELEKKNEST